jgi:hypothetical protein
MFSDILDEATPKTLPSYCPPLPQFTVNLCLNGDVVSPVKLLVSITEDFLECICDQTNMYASQVISTAPCPFTKH